ncbi:MAG: ATP-binding protein, partial [Byssovorax sp.]
FDDRVEIQSPGGPYGLVTKESFGKPGVTDYRNPTLAEAMKTLGFVQRFGVGIATANRALSANGNPPIAWQVDDRYVLAVVRRKQ